MLPRSIHVAIVDDHAIFRKTLTNFLSEQKNIHVTVQAADISELFDKLNGLAIDVLLLNISMPELNGDGELGALRSRYPGMKIVVLSMSTDVNMVSHLLENGIHAYISKADEPEELLGAIRTVAENRIYRNRIFTEALYLSRQNSIRASTKEERVSLSEREKKMLRLIWEEKSNKEMADELFLGVRSVEKIRQDLKEKIGVKSTVGLLKYAIEKHIVDPGFRNPRLI